MPENSPFARYDFPMSRSVWVSLLLPVLVSAQPGVRQLWKQKSLERLKAYAASSPGVVGVSAIDLTSGETIGMNGETVFPTASSIKIPVMIAMFRDAAAGRFQFSDPVRLTWVGNGDDSEGPLKERLMRGPVTLTVRQLVEAMMQWSDNSAANECIRMVGMDRVNALIRELGLRDTHLRRFMMDVAAARRGDENTSTPRDLARLMQLIYEGKAASAKDCEEMLAIMKGVQRPFLRPGIPADVEMAAKPGSLDEVRCEAAVVFLARRPFAVAVMSAYLEAGADPVPGAGKIVFDYFSRLAVSNEYGRGTE
jgi:beta-lactamase class A